MKKLKVALFSSLLLETPPKNNSIINAPLYLLTQIANILSKKHDLTLFGALGSKSKAKVNNLNLPPLSTTKIYKDYNQDPDKYPIKLKLLLLYNQLAFAKIYKQLKKFDLVHFYDIEGALPFSLLTETKTPILITIHNPYSEYHEAIFKPYKNDPRFYFNSLSNAQRQYPKTFNFISTVYNGTDINKFKFNLNPKDRLIVSGRLMPGKGIHTAVNVAKKTNKNLEIIGQIIPKYNDYWQGIKKQLNKNIKYKGIIPPAKIPSFYQNAKALLFPVTLRESFGLVMTESMACGTPVIAYKSGSVPEVIKDGVTGYIVKNEKEMIAATKKIYSMPKEEYLQMRQNCRKHVTKNFTIEKMVENYEKTYYKIINDFKKKK